MTRDEIKDKLGQPEKPPSYRDLFRLGISQEDLLQVYADEVEQVINSRRKKAENEELFDIAMRFARFEAGFIGKYKVSEIIEAYKKKYAEKFGEELSLDNPQNNLGINDFQPTSQTMLRTFGTWDNALRLLGLLPLSKSLTPEQMVEMLREKQKELGRTPKANDLGEYAYPIKMTLGGGSWSRALCAAGLTPIRKLTEEELLELIRQKARELQRVPVPLDLPQATVIQRYFKEKLAEEKSADGEPQKKGGWSYAVEMALKSDPEFAPLYKNRKPKRFGERKRIPRAQLCREIHELRQELGRAPHLREYRHGPLAAQVHGKWSLAVAAAERYAEGRCAECPLESCDNHSCEGHSSEGQL